MERRRCDLSSHLSPYFIPALRRRVAFFWGMSGRGQYVHHLPLGVHLCSYSISPSSKEKMKATSMSSGEHLLSRECPVFSGADDSSEPPCRGP